LHFSLKRSEESGPGESSLTMSKRTALKLRIQQFFAQLTQGCGRQHCPNENCASNSTIKQLSCDEAAVQAIHLASSKAELCSENHRSKIARTDASDSIEIRMNINDKKGISSADSSTQTIQPEQYCTTKQKIHENGYIPELKQAISNIFSNSKLLNRYEKIFALKTDLREEIAQGTETDKQWDSSAKMSVGSSDSKEDTVVEKETASEKSVSKKPDPQTVPYLPTVDVVFFRTLFARISEDAVLETVLHESLVKLVNLAEKAICTNPNEYKSDPNYLNMIVILLECPLLQSPESLEEMFPKFLKIVAKLPLAANVALAHHWSRYDGAQLKNVIETIQQLIAYQVAMHYLDQTDLVAHEDQRIIDASKCLNILFFASILGGEVDRTVDEKGAAEAQSMRNAPREEEAEFHLGLMDVAQLGTELKLTKLDSVAPLVPRVEFVNEALNDVIKIDKDYANYRVSQQGSNKFSFLHYQFLLTTLNKTTYLFYDNRVRIERRRTLMSSLFAGSAINPFLKIQVRRTHIINDTLVQLEMAAEDLKNLRKQLYVEFDGEEGADEGGVSKEFFALMVEEIFNPANGTFILVEESQLFWFNPQSFEGLMQYKLIGIILGLAIYNNCILEIKFPSFVYKKLLGRKARFRDIKDLHPVIYQSLCSLLEYTGDVEDDLMLTFQVEHQDVFGCTHHHDLKEGGVNIPVTKLNRQEYVDMYSDWLLNTSIEEQFNAFLGGFELVLSQSPLKYLFEASELELLLCGSEHYDFNALEESAEYDGGFTKDSQTVKDFWSVLHELSDEEKKTLLQFSTGSDRAPVGGLAKLKMILAKNGPDSDRLPTAHTCFNVILLPDYKNKKKLRELLLKAIKYSKGFGML
uniref:HECT-type E3 ubiquitin transferase n=1 Tax=Ciona savignyi TaxID=51511 RepID=H2ZI00_CIOSA